MRVPRLVVSLNLLRQRIADLIVFTAGQYRLEPLESKDEYEQGLKQACCLNLVGHADALEHVSTRHSPKIPGPQISDTTASIAWTDCLVK
jgi:hypothetical protein